MKLGEIFAAIMVFSFISIIFIFLATLTIGVTNDYILFQLQETVDTMYNDSMLTNVTQAGLQEVGDDYTAFNFHLDDIWLFVYVMFWITSLVVAYQSSRNNHFSFLGMLFYGTMFMLFILTIFSTLTEWFKTYVMEQILPTTMIVMPKFYYYLDHVGVFSLVHIVVCMIINMMDFDLSKINFRRKQEEAAIADEEIV